MSKVRAVNGYMLRKFTRDNKKCLIIVYLIDGEFFTQSKYYDVSQEKLIKVKERLDDYTTTNKEAEEVCRTIPLMTIINAVEDIIFKPN